MARVFDLSSGKESDDEHGLPGDVSTGTSRKRAKIKPSPLEKAWVRSAVTVALFVVVVASIAFLIFYLRPGGHEVDVQANTTPDPVVGGKGANTLGPPMKDI